jgi:hypothetical protein
MKSLYLLKVMAAVLFFAARAVEATPITWTDSASFRPNVYITQWTEFSQHPAVDRVSSDSPRLDLDSPLGSFFPAPGVPGNFANSERSTEVLTEGIVSLLGDFCLDLPRPSEHGKGPRTVPEPGVLGLLVLGSAVVAWAVWRRRTVSL